MNNIAQLSVDNLKPEFKIDKPVRLIELFAGIGSQAKALQNLGVDFERWVISEWEVNPTKSYKAIHYDNDNTDYSKRLNQKELINTLFNMGISNDGKEPMTLKQIARKNEKWLRETYNAYKATHNISNIMSAAGKDLNIVDTESYIYILTYSFPCQDLSIAGKQTGMSKGSKTRSSTLWEVKRLLNECTELPQVLLMENVTQVHSKKNSADFKKWIECLEDLGYSNYYADLNAKDYKVPQNRNRCLMVSLLGNYSYTFPLPMPLTKRLKDILETDVDEKYYISQELCAFITDPFRTKKKYTTINADVAIPLKARDYANWNGNYITDEIIGSTQKNAYRGSLNGPGPSLTSAMGEGGGNIPMIKQVAQLYPNSGNPQAGRIYDADGLCCSTGTAQGGNGMPKIIDDTSENNSQVVVVGNYSPSDRTAGIELEQRLEIKTDGTSNTLTTVQKDNLVVEPVCINSKDETGKQPSLSDRIYESDAISTAVTTAPFYMPNYLLDNCRVRKLTPKECFRLMTFDDADYEKCKVAGISDSALYKQAGNSIVVRVLMEIFKEMIKNVYGNDEL